MKYWILIVSFLIVSCAGYKDIRPGSEAYYDLRPGDVIWVHTGIIERKKVRFLKIEGDSLFAEPYSFNVDSITGIQKEYKSTANTSIAAGGAGLIVAGLTLAALVAYFSFFTKLSSLF